MDAFKRDRSSHSKTSSNSSAFRRRRDSWRKAVESDENNFPFLRNGAQNFKKKVLTERIEDTLPYFSSGSPLQITAQTSRQDPMGIPFPVLPISTQSYDIVTNFTSLRPEFLRYNPNHRRELLRRIEAEKRNDQGVSSEERNGSDLEDDGEDVLEVEKNRWNSRFACKVLLMCAVVLLVFYFSISVSVSHVSFEAYESSAEDDHKIEARGLLELIGNGLFPDQFMGLSHMSHLKHREHNCEVESPVQRSNSYDETLQNGGLFWNTCIVNEIVMGDGHEGRSDSVPLAEGSTANLSTIEVETLKQENVACSRDECLAALHILVASDSSSTDQIDSSHSEDLNLNDSLWTSQYKSDQSSQLVDQWPEKAGLSMSSPSESKDSGSYIVLRGVLGLSPILVGTISVVICLFTAFLKYFHRPNLALLSGSSLSFKTYIKAETGENIVIAAQMEETSSNKSRDITEGRQTSGLNAMLLPSDPSNVEFKEASGFRPPRVELLGEFSLRDAEAFKNDFGLNSKLKQHSDSQLSSNQKRLAGKKLSLSSDTADSHSAEKSASKRCSSKAIADKSGESDAINTPLRRSRRLQNRISSPLTS